jgi:phthiocerol/phenolphthiocerol synthesis type-I polyketide synthase D
MRALRYVAIQPVGAQADSHDESAIPAWTEMAAENIVSELESRLQAILARELGMPASAVHLHRPFPELGLDSMMAMTVLREAKRLMGFDVSATMLWDHPTISSMAAYLSEMLAPAKLSEDELAEASQETVAEAAPDSESSVLEALFDSVESATAGSESGI